MSARNKFVKVRLSLDEYAEVAKRADAQGFTMCEHIRQQLSAVHRALDVRSELSALRAQVTQGTTPTANDSLALETVLILRELAAGRDAQILGRVRAQLKAGSAA